MTEATTALREGTANSCGEHLAAQLCFSLGNFADHLLMREKDVPQTATAHRKLALYRRVVAHLRCDARICPFDLRSDIEHLRQCDRVHDKRGGISTHLLLRAADLRRRRVQRKDALEDERLVAKELVQPDDRVVHDDDVGVQAAVLIANFGDGPDVDDAVIAEESLVLAGDPQHRLPLGHLEREHEPPEERLADARRADHQQHPTDVLALLLPHLEGSDVLLADVQHLAPLTLPDRCRRQRQNTAGLEAVRLERPQTGNQSAHVRTACRRSRAALRAR
mmetsp:Transcript_22269/g.58167  ORF Transcript_22269/g.58167 Transcript_22269/m.58167 type:complete len:278 (-) Transcript_22269:216-1049(-)